MKTTILSMIALSLLGLPPATSRADTTNKAPQIQKTVVEHKTDVERKTVAATNAVVKKPVAGPFHGRLAAIDKSAKTITVGKRTFQITSETKLAKDGKPATFDAGVAGEECSGYVKPADGGKWVATSVTFGAKPEKAAKKAGE